MIVTKVLAVVVLDHLAMTQHQVWGRGGGDQCRAIPTLTIGVLTNDATTEYWLYNTHHTHYNNIK